MKIKPKIHFMGAIVTREPESELEAMLFRIARRWKNRDSQKIFDLCSRLGIEPHSRNSAIRHQVAAFQGEGVYDIGDVNRLWADGTMMDLQIEDSREQRNE